MPAKEAPDAGADRCKTDPPSRRRQAFVDAAAATFFANGYGNATMSSIAAHVGGSKSTLWSYFPSKEALFAAVVDDIIERHGAALSIRFGSDDEDVRSVLRRFGLVLMQTLLSEPVLNLHRLVIGEAARFPHLAELFYERGPQRGQSRLAAYLNRAMEKSRLRRDDPNVAARQFSALCQAGFYQQAIMNLRQAVPDTEIERDVEFAVEAFCGGWGAGD